MKEKNILRKIADVIVAELGLSKEEAKLMEVKLEQMKLDDGVTIIEADSFEVESEVMIVTEDQRIPLPVGEYQIEDGRKLTVTVEGVIASIEMPQEEAPEVEEEVVASTQPTAPAPAPKDPKSIIESTTREVRFSADEIDAIVAERDELKVKLAEMETKLSEVVTPITYNPEAKTKVQVDLSKADKRTRITNELNNLIK